MKLRSITEYTHKGKRRRIRLYAAYQNMRGRLAGRQPAGDGSTPWKGLACDFKDFADFRAWALANGYSKANNSLDRAPFPDEGYVRHNLRWVSVSANTKFENQCRWHGAGSRRECLDDLLNAQYPTGMSEGNP
jgi:hypothetical protein